MSKLALENTNQLSFKTPIDCAFSRQRIKKSTIALNSGCGQGTLLGFFLVCIKFNGACPKLMKENIGKIITQPKKSRKPIPVGKKKWIDDLTLNLPISLKENLIADTRTTTVKPVPYHGRTGQRLPKSRSQQAPGSGFQPRDESDKFNCVFVGPSCCNRKVDPEKKVTCTSYVIWVSNVAHQMKEKKLKNEKIVFFLK